MIKSYLYPLIKRKIKDFFKSYIKSFFITAAMGGTIVILLGVIIYMLINR